MEGVKEEVIEGNCTPWMDSGVVVKLEPAWSMEEDSPDHPSAIYSTVQPMSDNTSGSLLSLKRGCVCQHCSAAFVLVSSLELHLVSVHGEPLPFPEWTESSDRQMALLHGRLSSEEMDHVRKYSADSNTEFVLKQEPAWSTEEDSPDQPSAVYSTEQPIPDNTSGSLLSLNTSHVSPTPDRCDASSNTDIDKEIDSHGKGKRTRNKVDDSDTGDKDGKKRSRDLEHDVYRKSFPPANEPRRSKLIHSGHKPFVCDVCGKSFTQATQLTNHKRVHTGERPYKCPHCDSSFKSSSNLQVHIKSVHDDTRPHVCDVCGTAFSQTGDLKVHRRIHTGEKPFVCSDCGKGFTNSGNLKKHCLTHTGGKPHVCPDCGKGFAQSNNLTIHRLTHSGEKPHSCPHCPSAFGRSQHLKRHVRNVHQH